MNATLPPKARTTPPPPVSQQSTTKVTFGQVSARKGHRVVLFGTGGIGKTTLACLLPGKTAFIDADESLAVLKSQLEAIGVAIPAIVPANSFGALRSSLRASGWDGINNVVIDTATKIEEMAVAQTLASVPNEHGKPAKSIEGYGYGKGFQHVFDTFLPLLADLDSHVRAGRNVVLVAHECTSPVPNPLGEDWIRYEPRLQSPNSGKASIRHRVKEWADHVLFLGYDVNVEDGKAQGSGARTLYTAERPSFMAKSRTTSESFDITLGGESVWEKIIK